LTVVQGLIDQLQRNKLLLIETQDAAETTLALANYQKVTGQYRTYVLRYTPLFIPHTTVIVIISGKLVL